jgi:hypothetical protein
MPKAPGRLSASRAWMASGVAGRCQMDMLSISSVIIQHLIAIQEERQAVSASLSFEFLETCDPRPIGNLQRSPFSFTHHIHTIVLTSSQV